MDFEKHNRQKEQCLFLTKWLKLSYYYHYKYPSGGKYHYPVTFVFY